MKRSVQRQAHRDLRKMLERCMRRVAEDFQDMAEDHKRQAVENARHAAEVRAKRGESGRA